MAPLPIDNSFLSSLMQSFRKSAVDDARVWPLIGLATLGALTLLASALSTLRVIFSVILPGKSLSSFGAKKGAWAVITGTTQGIGEEYARQLARAGFSILLVSRDAAKLQQQATDLRAKTKVQVKTFAIDLVNATKADYDRFAELVASLDVGVLVNNAGQSSPYPEYFVDQQQAVDESIIAINIDALVRVTRMIAPGMVKRKRGLIINMGSYSGYAYTPLLATYAASKQFVFSFSAVLGRELAPHGITVTSQNAYFVVSNMSKIRKPTMLAPTPRSYVRSVLGHIGQGGGAAGGLPYLANPYPSHAIVQWATDRFVPYWLLQYIGERTHVDIRRRYFAKQARLAKKQ